MTGVQKGNTMTNENASHLVEEMRRDIIQVCRLLHQKGFVAATDGNVTARLDPHYIIATPSGVSKALLAPEQLIILTAEGEMPAETPFGPNPAGLRMTSEILLHLEVYRQREDVNAIVHAHPPISIALSIAGIPISEALLPEVLVALGTIPLTPYATPSTAEGAAIIRRYIHQHDAVLLRRHGSVTVGKTPMEAYLKTEKVEHAAEITYHLTMLGVDAPLRPREIAKLIEQKRARGIPEEDLSQLERFARLVWHRSRRRR